MTPVDPSRLDSLLASVEKSYRGSMRKGDQYNETRRRISTGSIELDYATGGGFPLGSVIRLWGGPSSGKTLIALNAIKNAQADGFKCVYYNIEKQYDQEYVRKLGVDVSDLLVHEGTIIEEIGEAMEQLFQGAHVHVLDSCTTGLSNDEISTSLKEWRPGIRARAWGKTLARVMSGFDQTDHLVILIDQSRESFGYASEVAPGGRYMEHLSHLTIQVKRGKHLYLKGGVLSEDGGEETVSGQKQADGFVSKALIRKTKVGRPGRSAEMLYDYETCSFDQGYEAAKVAVFFGIVERKGAWYKLPDGTQVQGEAKLRLALLSDPSLLATVREEAMKRI